MYDLDFKSTFRRGDKSRPVRLIQEWLSLRDYQVKIDGIFGPATHAAVMQFQQQQNLPANGVVDHRTFTSLTAPLRQALKTLPVQRRSLGQWVVAYAEQHLIQRPREIGGQNRGPWVRLYMNGREGASQYWCAGFVSFILRQACDTLNQGVPFKTSVACDVLARQAIAKGRFIMGKANLNRSELTPGCFFLSRRTAQDWNHTGIITQLEADYFQTIEGNTNDSGDPDGYEVCRRIRNYDRKDYLRI